MRKKITNVAFIDGQNLHLGVRAAGWCLDYARLRIYLRDKYKVEHAYYFFGVLTEENMNLYTKLQKAGFIVQFRDHKGLEASKKKGNVDTDVVFSMMKSLVEDTPETQIVLLSGDGDYKRAVSYLIEKSRFLKILFPQQKKASSLYKQLTSRFYADLSETSLKKLLEYKK